MGSGRGATRRVRVLQIAVGMGGCILLVWVGSVFSGRARMAALEQVALENLRMVVKSCQFYFLANQAYPSDLTVLQHTSPQYLEKSFTASLQGYRFTYTAARDFRTFILRADPLDPGVSGARYYYTDQGVMLHPPGLRKILRDLRIGLSDDLTASITDQHSCTGRALIDGDNHPNHLAGPATAGRRGRISPTHHEPRPASGQ